MLLHLGLGSVAPESVRERINVSAAEAPDDAVNRFISAVAVTVGLEIGEDVDASNFTRLRLYVILRPSIAPAESWVALPLA
jgi:hypothetical protein